MTPSNPRTAPEAEEEVCLVCDGHGFYLRGGKPVACPECSVPDKPAAAPEAVPSQADRDWPEGRDYTGICHMCGLRFVGPKARIQGRKCRACAGPSEVPAPAPDRTADELRVAVALHYGWKWVGNRILMGVPVDLYSSGPGDHCSVYGLPNYPDSLDACATFEATLTEDERTDYVHALGEIATVGGDMGWGKCTASPIQRCRAFLAVKEAGR